MNPCGWGKGWTINQCPIMVTEMNHVEVNDGQAFLKKKIVLLWTSAEEQKCESCSWMSSEEWM